jgi:hypothetical protein
MRLLIIKLQGGLGNQMFQFAFGISLSKKLNAPLYFDLSFYEQDTGLTPRQYELGIFTPSANIADRGLLKRILKPNLIQKFLVRNTVYKERNLLFAREVFDVKPPAYFDGFWQSEKYFTGVEQAVRNAFTFKIPLNPKSQKIATALAQIAGAVSVHVRRGDYVNSKETHDLHGICTTTYYQNAMDLMKQRVINPAFYFFSDDPEWVKRELLPVTDHATLIQHNPGTDSWQDIVLMSKCKHHIIANSSFSWWGAWLNPDPEKIVIAPTDWFNCKTAYFDATDMVPGGWIRVANV